MKRPTATIARRTTLLRTNILKKQLGCHSSSQQKRGSACSAERAAVAKKAKMNATHFAAASHWLITARRHRTLM